MDKQENLEELYSIQSFIRRSVGIAVATVAITALTGFGLSFTALSPLMVGVVLGGALSASIVAAAIGLRCYFSKDINEAKRHGAQEGRVIAALMPFFITTALTSVAAGVGLAVTANAIFPGVMLGMESAALAGGIIGAIALPIAVITGIIVTGMFVGNLAQCILPNQRQYCRFNEPNQDSSEDEDEHDVESSLRGNIRVDEFSSPPVDQSASRSYGCGSRN